MTTLPPYNVPLMQQIRTQITEHPETHHQGSWRLEAACGTTQCIAGWAVTLAGLKWDDGHTLNFGSYRSWYSVLENGVNRPASDAARDLLGLDDDEAHHLFSSHSGRLASVLLLDSFIEAGQAGGRVDLDARPTCKCGCDDE